MQILIVDDSKAMRMIVARTMRQAGYADHEFDEAADGAEALAKINACPPDLVLSDWNMPQLSGLDLLRILRSSGSRVPFGFVTAESTPAMRNLADETGASFFVAKPFTADSLRAALAGILD